MDPVQLERGRMQQVSGGIVPTPPGQVDGLVYVALQELATRVSHLNTAKAMPDRAGYEVLKRVATDENLHHLYYRDLVAEALRIDPSLVLEAIDRQVRSFQMPGIGLPGFAAHAKAIAAHGIYDLSIHYEQILAPVLLRHWAIDQLSGLDASGEQARDRVLEYLRRLERLALRRAARAADAAPST